MRLERHPAVLAEDLPAVFEYIARNDPAAAERVLDAVGFTLEQLLHQPEIGPIYRARNPSLKNVRMLPVKGYENYLIFYRVDHEVVRILYVVHCARDLMNLFQRFRRD